MQTRHAVERAGVSRSRTPFEVEVVLVPFSHSRPMGGIGDALCRYSGLKRTLQCGIPQHVRSEQGPSFKIERSSESQS